MMVSEGEERSYRPFVDLLKGSESRRKHETPNGVTLRKNQNKFYDV